MVPQGAGDLGEAGGRARRGDHLSPTGRIAHKQRDFASAEQWYHKSLAIEEKQGDEHGAAATYHQLGMIAQEQRDFASAEQWYRKALAILEKQGDEHGAAFTYHQLGMIAQEQRDFASAEQWYRKSLAIWVKYGDKHYEAMTRSFWRVCGKRPGQDRSRNRGKRNPLLSRETSVGQILPIGSRTTPMMDDMIRGLDDSQAVRVLKTFARARLRAGGVAETEWTPELDRALRQDFPAEADAGRAASVSEGDLARQALLLLADDPQNRDALAALIEGPPPESFEVVTAAPSPSSPPCWWCSRPTCSSSGTRTGRSTSRSRRSRPGKAC